MSSIEARLMAEERREQVLNFHQGRSLPSMATEKTLEILFFLELFHSSFFFDFWPNRSIDGSTSAGLSKDNGLTGEERKAARHSYVTA